MHSFMTDQVHTPSIGQNPPPGPKRRVNDNLLQDFGYLDDHDRRVHELAEKAMHASQGQYNRLPGHIKRVLDMYISWRSRDGSPWARIFHWTSYIRSDETQAHSYQGYFDSLTPYWQKLLLEGAIINGNPHGPDFESEWHPAESPARTGNPYIITSM